MAEQRRTESEVEPARPPASFDEQLWPVNVALLVLAGFVAGAIIAQSNFAEEPRLLYNGWVRLASLAVSTGLLMWVASRLNSQQFQRALQLATLVSIIVHVVLIVVLYKQSDPLAANVFDPDAQPRQEADKEPEELVVQPEYHMEAPGESAREEAFQRPVEAAARDERPAPIQREQPSKTTPRAKLAEPIPEKMPDVQHNPIKMAERREAAPRKGPQPSKFSKRAAENRINPDNPAPATPDTKITDQPTAKVEPQVAAVERQAKSVSADSPTRPAPLAEPAAAVRQQQAVTPTRREHTESRPREMSSIPLARQRLNEPAEMPRADVIAPKGDVSPASGPRSGPEPSVQVTRQRAGGPMAVEQPGKDVKIAAGPSRGPLDAPRHESAEQPRLAMATQGAVGRSAKGPSLPTAGDGMPAGAAPGLALGPAEPNQLAPGATAIARTGPATSLPAAMRAGAAADAPARPTVAMSPQLQRAVATPLPSLTAGAKPAGQLARATRTAAKEASPVAIDSPAPAQQESGTGPPEPAAQPGRAALAKGTAGIHGIGGGPNLDRGESATAQPASVASISASRPQRTQAGQEGPALSPSAPAAIAKSTAGVQVPTATLPADEIASPNALGAGPGRVSNIEASSSAAVGRADATAPKGLVSVGVGTGQIDVGPTQIVAAPGSVGNAAGAGGGEPTLNLSKPTGPQPRTSGGGPPLISLAAQDAADIAQAPPGKGGGAPVASPQAAGPALAASRVGGSGDLPLANVAVQGRLAGAGGLASAGNGVGSEIGAGGTGAGGTGVAGVAIARAATGQTDGVAGPSIGGQGATPRLSRSSGAPFTAETKAEMPQLPGSGGSGPGGAAGQGGNTNVIGDGTAAGTAGTPVPAATAIGPTRTASGLPGQPTGGPVGVDAADTVIDSPIVGAPGNGLNPRKVDAAGDEDAPAVAVAPMTGTLRKANVAGAVLGSPEAIADIPGDGSQEPSGGAPAQAGELSLKPEAGTPGRRAGSLPVQVAALDGSGGLGEQFSPDVGSQQRRAQRDSETVHAGSGRFLGRKVGGPVVVDGRARESARAFAGRGNQRKGLGSGSQPLERTEDAVELGLAFLARHRQADGRWSLNGIGAGRPGYENEEAAFQSDTAATGLALLSFLGAGYDHYDDQYQSVVAGGLQFLTRHQQPSGDLYLPQDPISNQSARLYSHGISTIALCEAYGMTGDEALRPAAQKAIDFIVASQHPTMGGWRYKPQVLSDTSVSGWQLMALKSGELAGLKVPDEAYRLARHWLDTAQASPQDGSQYAYNPFAANTPEQRHGQKPTTTMTAVGLLMRLYLGWNRNDPNMQRGAQHLLQNLPSLANQNQRDTYYWYYATQVMFHMKGEYWRQWNERLHPLLIERQIQTGPLAGSWDPLGPVPDKWGAKAGRIYVTTLNLLSLEVYYRHLPIYESEAR